MTPDNPNFVPQSELPSSTRFEQALQRLSGGPETLAQIRPSDIDINEIRQSLTEAGCSLDIGEAERLALQERQFRSLDSGRGVGVTAILGRERAEGMMELIPQLAEGRGKIGGKEGTEGRGLRQFVADTFKLAISEKPTDEEINNYCTRVNERVFKGYLKAKEYKGDENAQTAITQAFAGVEDKSDIGEFSSIPPATLDKLWAFIVSK
jgi:hypothetical protein